MRGGVADVEMRIDVAGWVVWVLHDSRVGLLALNLVFVERNTSRGQLQALRITVVVDVRVTPVI